MDGRNPLKLDHYKRIVEERSGKIPNGQKWYILNKIFNMMPVTIAEMEKKNPRVVREMIIRVSDQLRAGEIRLFEFSYEEAEAAQKRLDEVRRKDREKKRRRKAALRT